MKIQQKAILVTLSIGSIPTLKKDKKSATEIEEKNGAEIGKASTASKKVIDKKYVNAFNNAVSKARAIHNKLTANWGTPSTGILPMENYLEYQQKIMIAKAEIESEGNNILNQLQEIDKDAQIRLGNLYRQEDIPDYNKIQKRVYCEIKFFPIPDDNFFINASNDIIDDVTKEVRESFNNALKSQNQDLAKRLYEIIEHIYKKTLEKGETFRNSLIDNLSEIIGLLPKLNVFDDPVINDLIQDAKKLEVEPNEIRKNDLTRETINKEAKAIMDKLESFI